MDYDALANILPHPTHTWNEQQVSKWLQFVHLPALAPLFLSHRINGSALLKLNLPNLDSLGINNTILQRKMLRWIKEGFDEFEQHLQAGNIENKQNIPPMQRKNTTQRQFVKPRLQKTKFHLQDSMVVRSCDGNLAAYFVTNEKSLKIGRSANNTIRSLQVSVQNQHAQIYMWDGLHYIRDCGTKAGTFIKIIQPRILQLGTLIQMGSFLMMVTKIDKQTRNITLDVQHMISRGNCDLFISLMDGCSAYSFGRRKTNDFAFDDEHLSGIHARIFMLNGQFILQDLHSTNGTWLRLSLPSEPSSQFQLSQGNVFKIGTTITYQCQGQRMTEQKMDIEYDDHCVLCNRQKKNVVMVPCRHNIVCHHCAQKLTECVLCKSVIEERIKIYI